MNTKALRVQLYPDLGERLSVAVSDISVTVHYLYTLDIGSLDLEPLSEYVGEYKGTGERGTHCGGWLLLVVREGQNKGSNVSKLVSKRS